MPEINVPALRRLRDNTTQGPKPWHLDDDGEVVVGRSEWSGYDLVIDTFDRAGDAEFIATAHTVWPALLDEIERLRGQIAIAWEQGYQRAVKDETLELERADNPYLQGDET